MVAALSIILLTLQKFKNEGSYTEKTRITKWDIWL